MASTTVDVALTAVVTVLPVLNKYKVPNSQWRKWGQVQKQLFNDTYSYMRNNQKLFMHPKGSKIELDHWNTISWNAAWIATDNLKNQKLVKVRDGC